MKNSFNTIYASRGLNLSRFKLVGNLSLLVGKSRISTSFSYPGFVVQVGILVLFWFQTKSLCRKTLELVASLGFPWFEGSTSPNTVLDRRELETSRHHDGWRNLDPGDVVSS